MCKYQGFVQFNMSNLIVLKSFITLFKTHLKLVLLIKIWVSEGSILCESRLAHLKIARGQNSTFTIDWSSHSWRRNLRILERQQSRVFAVRAMSWMLLMPPLSPKQSSVLPSSNHEWTHPLLLYQYVVRSNLFMIYQFFCKNHSTHV